MKLTAFQKQIFCYSIAMALLLALLKWLELRLLILTHAFEVYAGMIALIFTALGVWLAQKIAKPKIETVYVEKQVQYEVDQAKADALKISRRESEVLALIAKGFSNSEIAAALFVSPNTVKTHVSSVFSKLGTSKRVQAVEKAHRLGLIHSPESSKNIAGPENHPKV